MLTIDELERGYSQRADVVLDDRRSSNDTKEHFFCTVVALASGKLDELAQGHIDVRIGIAILERAVSAWNAILRKETSLSIQGDIQGLAVGLAGKELACIGQVKNGQG